jgi:hypothetical protein
LSLERTASRERLRSAEPNCSSEEKSDQRSLA